MGEQIFKKGQKCRDCFGKIVTVMRHEGCQVFVYENCGAWYHPTKLFPIVAGGRA